MDRENIALPDRQGVLQRLGLLQRVGPHALPGCILPIEEELYFLNIRARKDGLIMTPVLCYGPFGDREITLLAGAPIEKGILGARDVLPIARHNLETLKQDRRRRVLHENRTNRTF